MISSSSATYTFTGTPDCDGWRGISLDECEQHCTNNDLPTGCKDEGKQCEYVQYRPNPGWCHLVDASVKFELALDGSIYEKGEKLVVSVILPSC